MNFEKVISIIKENSGTQLQEDVVDAFLRLVDRGELRAEDDNGGGTFEDITNIHKKQERDFAKKTAGEEILKKEEGASSEKEDGKSDKSEGKEQ